MLYTNFIIPISDTNEDDVDPFVASRITQWAKENHKDKIEKYLNYRVEVLTKALNFINRKSSFTLQCTLSTLTNLFMFFPCCVLVIFTTIKCFITSMTLIQS